MEKVHLAADFLKMAFEGGIHYRTERAARFPDDKRNDEAVAIFKNLIATIDQCDMPLLQSWADLNVHDDTTRQTEIMNDLTASVGFSYWPANAEVFVQDFNTKSVN